MYHCLATASVSVTYASHFLAVVLVRLDQIQPYPEKDGCVNRRGARSSKHVLRSIFSQLDPFYCKSVFRIELLLQGATIELRTRNGFVNNCENRLFNMSAHDSKLAKVELGQTDRIATIWRIIFRESYNEGITFGRTSFRDDEAHISDGVNRHRVDR
jgi:hypothetical protein